jgi:glycosyltransferase involved in cell wall biosynthesis
MATDRKLINYLPHFMQVYREMATITETEQTEIDRLWVEAENALADQFILEATENGVKRWESMLGISPKDTDTLDERKFRILTKLNQELPYTLRKLEQALVNLCGNDMFSINVSAEEYHIEIKLGLSNKNNYQEVTDVLKKMIPANMTQWVQIMYNNHNVLAQFTHAEMNAYTHERLRSEVFANLCEGSLIFPSYIETFGYPLIEAAQMGAIVLAADCPYAHEVLCGYDNVYYFDPFKPEALAELIKKVVRGDIENKNVFKRVDDGENTWKDVVCEIISAKKE